MALILVLREGMIACCCCLSRCCRLCSRGFSRCFCRCRLARYRKSGLYLVHQLETTVIFFIAVYQIFSAMGNMTQVGGGDITGVDVVVFCRGPCLVWFWSAVVANQLLLVGSMLFVCLGLFFFVRIALFHVLETRSSLPVWSLLSRMFLLFDTNSVAADDAASLPVQNHASQSRLATACLALPARLVTSMLTHATTTTTTTAAGTVGAGISRAGAAKPDGGSYLARHRELPLVHRAHVLLLLHPQGMMSSSGFAVFPLLVPNLDYRQSG